MTVQQPLFFVQRFKGRVQFNVPMSEHTTFRIGGPADVMVFPRDEGDLAEIIKFAESKRFHLYVFSGGSNLLVRDKGIRGIVVNMSEGFADVVWPEETKAVAGAGVRLGVLVKECRDRGLTGLEFAGGIPGTVGGAVFMNAGAWGSEMKDVVEGVEVMGRKGRRGFLSSKDLDFSYRSSNIPEGSVITRVQMRFAPSTPAEVEERIREYARRRQSVSAAIALPNAGSVFKNPAGEVAGKLIDEAGLKGASYGDASVSEVHANYIVNRGRAAASDVLRLMALMRDKVYSRTGIVLEPEIRVVGED
ncbi:MAG TPA: UDP-N-acetylmuramate dehydrogenase [Thermodesulfobacteriota bacterium]|nr:UDP-N-acetylmuramate dehydrogenase [Thermodesulfobacteriota bacterium]